MRLTIKIECDNAAFTDQPGYEISGILRKLAAQAEYGRSLCEPGSTVVIMDSNGNRVGDAKMSGRKLKVEA